MRRRPWSARTARGRSSTAPSLRASRRCRRSGRTCRRRSRARAGASPWPGCTTPARRSSRSPGSARPRERGLTGEARRVVELEAERARRTRALSVGADVVGGHAAAGEEGAVVDRRALDRDALRPPAHSIWATFVPPRSADWAIVSACSTPCVERRGAVGERLAVDVERVVRRAGDARPRAGGQAVPARAGVRRGLGQQPVAGRRGALLEEAAAIVGSEPCDGVPSRRCPDACRRRRRRRACRSVAAAAVRRPRGWTAGASGHERAPSTRSGGRGIRHGAGGTGHRTPPRLTGTGVAAAGWVSRRSGRTAPRPLPHGR